MTWQATFLKHALIDLYAYGNSYSVLYIYLLCEYRNKVSPYTRYYIPSLFWGVQFVMSCEICLQCYIYCVFLYCNDVLSWTFYRAIQLLYNFREKLFWNQTSAFVFNTHITAIYIVLRNNIIHNQWNITLDKVTYVMHKLLVLSAPFNYFIILMKHLIYKVLEYHMFKSLSWIYHKTKNKVAKTFRA